MPRSVRTTVLNVAVATAVATTLTVTVTGASATSQHTRPAATAAPLIFGHRGAPGYRPEHTAAGYALAAAMGADYLEPDLVPTKDGFLVDRHEPEISTTTDVANHPEFADRRTTKRIDGVRTTGWFTTDFTLAELETLHANERLPDIRQHNTLYNGRYRIPTLQDDITQAEALSRQYHRRIGIIPEIKHSSFFASIGLPMENRVLDVLARNGLTGSRPRIPVIVQSFEVHNLRYLHNRTRLPLMQLTEASGAPADFVAAGDPRTYADLVTPSGLRAVARYATYLGPDKTQIVPRDAHGRILPATSLIPDAHRAGLLVGPYTFRNENTFLPVDFRRGTDPADYGNAFAEDELYFSLGVDAIFTDNADTGVAARAEWIAQGRPHHAAA